MVWEVLLIAPIAAATGILTRKIAEYAAERAGHSRRDADEALATAGLSLILREKEEFHHDDRAAPPVAGRV